jgi:hypothetical protein
MAQRDRFVTCPGCSPRLLLKPAPPPFASAGCCISTHRSLFLSFLSPYLSRACLGKIIVCSIQMGHDVRCFTFISKRSSKTAGFAGSHICKKTNEKRTISPFLRVLSRCLSRACLGKSIIFRYKLLKRCAFFALPVAPSRGLDALQAPPARPGCPA